MSILSPQDHLNPQNPLYYAPRWLRERSERPSASLSESTSEFSETGSERLKRPISTRSSYDALLEGAVADALQHPLDPEVIHEPPGFARERDQRTALLGVAGRFAAAIGISAIVALFFVIMVPASQDHARQPDGGGSSISGILHSVKAALSLPTQGREDSKPALSEFQTILTSTQTSQPAPTHEQSETLLQQFMQWQQKPTQAP
ncbi:MAG: hypothetical protein IJ935_11880 [Afipia sp.]|jgi:hypothetical protein|nr:hypothetical protein [Afipia sp.]